MNSPSGISFVTSSDAAGTSTGSERLGINNVGETTIKRAGSGGSGVLKALNINHAGTSVNDGAKISFTAGASTEGAGISSTGQALNSADLRFYAGGDSEKMRITSAGSVGIGTTAPGRVLEVSHSANTHTPVLRLSGMSTSAYSGGLSWYSGYGPKETAEMHSTASGSQGGEWWLNVRNQNSNAQSKVMAVNNSGRLRLTGVSDGASGAFNVMGEVGNSYDAIQFYHNSTTLVGRIRTAASSTSYNTSSDYRLKENVVTDWDATTRLKQLKPSRFNFITDAGTTVDGFLAHEVSSVVPEAITGTKDAVDSEGNPDYQGIDQSKLVPLLVKTIQELEARITTLENA